jgi:hypothetical protein
MGPGPGPGTPGDRLQIQPSVCVHGKGTKSLELIAGSIRSKTFPTGQPIITTITHRITSRTVKTATTHLIPRRTTMRTTTRLTILHRTTRARILLAHSPTTTGKTTIGGP